MEVHLAQCTECQRELRQLQASGGPHGSLAWVDVVQAVTSQTAMARDGIRTHARRLTRLVRLSATLLSSMRRARADRSASLPMRRRSPLTMLFLWSVGTAAAVVDDVRAARRIVMTIYRGARSGRLRMVPAGSFSRPPDVMTMVLRIGSGVMSVALVTTLWCLGVPDHPAQSTQPTASPQRTAVPTSVQAEEFTPPRHAPVQSGAVPDTRSNIRRATGSPAMPKTQADIPMPLRIPAPSSSSSTASAPEDSRVGNPGEMTSENAAARDPASVIDWLLRDEQRSPSRRGRNENP
jgi:hypothetical protein